MDYTVSMHLLHDFGQLQDYSSSKVDLIHTVWELLIHHSSERDNGLAVEKEIDTKIVLDKVHKFDHSSAEPLNALQRF